MPREKQGKIFLFKILLCFFLLLLACSILLKAWISDDAFITFRTIDNLFNGYGLRWNVAERVQTYTHPLWMFLLAGMHALTREFFFTTIIFSIIVSLIAAMIVTRGISRSPAQSLLALAILTCSKAFTEYSTSGLENPLNHLLIAVFFLFYFRHENSLSKLLYLSLAAGAAALNRLDTVLLFIPPLFFTYCKTEKKIKALCLIIAGFFPLTVWELFSLLYYGFPFPNTFYAKLSAEVGGIVLLRHGLYYVADSLMRDAVTLPAIMAGMILALFQKDKKHLFIAAGMILYLLYLLKIGGDFMSGRFFTATLFCATIIIAKSEISMHRAGWATAFGCLLVSACIPGFFDLHARIPEKKWGVTDERKWYYEAYGLIPAVKNLIQPGHVTEEQKFADYLKEKGVSFFIVKKAGAACFYAGPTIHFIDVWALTDPLLSRLPMAGGFRPGHVERIIPDGYPVTLMQGKNVLFDSNLALFYDKLKILTREYLLDKKRLQEIWHINTGRYDHFLQAYAQNPQSRMLQIKFSDIQKPAKEGAAWDAQGNIIFQRWGMLIDLGKRCYNKKITVSFNNIFKIIYLNSGNEIATTELEYLVSPALAVRTIDVPEAAALQGFDSIKILPYPYTLFSGEMCSIGHLTLE